MMPEMLMIESDHDMRNSADFLVLNKLAKGIFGVEGVALVQGVTRPEGTPLAAHLYTILAEHPKRRTATKYDVCERPAGGHA